MYTAHEKHCHSALQLSVTTNRCVFSARRKCPCVMSNSHSWVGRLFHTRGPAAANEWSPRSVLVRCTRYVSMSDDAVVGVQWQTAHTGLSCHTVHRRLLPWQRGLLQGSLSRLLPLSWWKLNSIKLETTQQDGRLGKQPVHLTDRSVCQQYW